ncbi:hypothetical protein TIFTF001_045558 [Ficus carica]|uniref:Retrotransposon gag domain-containing protein n=1 Tax=Ficus carica TaxID=3494 RepID=A0AA87Z0U8_FICCA|nr:hypothetical protein TIFTF001_045552 [Ficus carica]GMN21772.1 hypothetical protein TIFTF001_045554 [Ficus carica]GMN21780.1 hypothetical protein TIFTF001_045556 [Ficus carica]GMN21796.1 hypothetical protein TIFTF001_045558 [Ficus carica]
MDPAQVEEDRRSFSTFYQLRPLLFDGTPRTVALSVWLYDLEMIFHLCHVEAHLRVSLAIRCLAADARLWWMTIGEETLPDRTWPHFRTCMINRYGPVPEEGIEEPYRDPEIYRDMQHERFHVLVADWHAYPHEPMDHYCRRFQEAMLPHIPMDIPHPGLQTLVILRNGLPPQIRQHTPIPTPIMTVAQMVGYILAAEVIAHDLQADAHVVEPEVPDDDAGIPEPVYEPEPAYEPEPVYEPEPTYEPDPIYEPEPAYEPGPVDPEDAMPADPVQEAEDDGYDADEDMDAPEDPPIIVISSDDEDDDEEPDHEPGLVGWPDEGDDFEEDPEEIPGDDGEADSDVSDVTVVEID